MPSRCSRTRWSRRGSGATRACSRSTGYRETGGIRGAVAQSADRLYESLSPDQRALVRSVLMRLVAPSLDGDPVRCRVPSRALLGDAGRERVVALLVRSRLVTAEQETFELAHEALARAWPRLQAWLDEDVGGQRILRHLGVAADGWDSLGRPPSELYRGARLDAALEWQAAARPDLTALERSFLDASVSEAASQSRALAARARRLRVLLATAMRPARRGLRRRAGRAGRPSGRPRGRARARCTRRSSTGRSRCARRTAAPPPCSRWRPTGGVRTPARGRRCSGRSRPTRRSWATDTCRRPARGDGRPGDDRGRGRA